MGKNYICALLCGAMIISQAIPLYAESIIPEEIAACEDEGAWAAETECENESAQAAEAGFLLTVNGAQESCSDIVDAICSVSSK